MEALKHERGHAVYNANHTTEYREYKKRTGVLNNKNYDGHAPSDPSGKAAEKAEKRKL